MEGEGTSGRAKSQFKRWLSNPPRPHGATIADRTVSNLELFYDLVYVAVIGQAARLPAKAPAGGQPQAGRGPSLGSALERGKGVIQADCELLNLGM
jgi:hypothetical protein